MDPKRRSRALTILSYTLAAVIIIVSVIAWRYVSQVQATQAKTAFDSRVSSVAHAAEDVIHDVVEVADVYKVFFETDAESVTADEFSAIYNTYAHIDYPGIAAINYATPEGGDLTQLIVRYSESDVESQVGKNILEDKEKSSAANRARDSGAYTYSSLIDSNIYLYAPLYSDANVSDAKSRQDAFAGVVEFALNPEEILDSLSGLIGDDLTLSAYLEDDAGSIIRIFGEENTQAIDEKLVTEQEIVSAQRTFILKMQAAAGFASMTVREIAPTFVFVGGLIISILTLTSLLALARARRSAAQLAGKMTKQIKASRDSFRVLLEALPDSAVVINRLGIIKRVNKKAIEDVGVPREKLEGHPFSKVGVVAPSSLPKVLKNFAITAAGGKHKPYDVEITTKGGVTRTYEVNSQPLKGLVEGGGVQVVFRDITQRKRSAEQLEKQKSELERINKFMVGRELNMQQLKKENEELKQKLREQENE